MTFGSAYLLFVMLVAAFAGWYLIVVEIPKCLTSTFRYRMWKLRDEIVDDIHSGALPSSPAVWRLVRNVEWTIVHASHITPWSFGWLACVAQCQTLRESTSQDVNILATIEPEHKRFIMAKYMARFALTFLRHLMRGSPSGWLVAPWVLIYLQCWLLKNKLSRKSRNEEPLIPTAVGQRLNAIVSSYEPPVDRRELAGMV